MLPEYVPVPQRMLMKRETNFFAQNRECQP
jgi:hypothetical protein